MADSPFIRDDEGRVTNPPVIPEFERRLTDAANRNDTDDIAEIQDEYNKAREDEVQRIESRLNSQDDPQTDTQADPQTDHSPGFTEGVNQ